MIEPDLFDERVRKIALRMYRRFLKRVSAQAHKNLDRELREMFNDATDESLFDYAEADKADDAADACESEVGAEDNTPSGHPKPDADREKIASACDKTPSPGDKASSFWEYTFNPGIKSVKPRDRTYSPRDKTFSPRDRTFSTGTNIVSPRTRSSTPRARTISPRHRRAGQDRLTKTSHEGLDADSDAGTKSSLPRRTPTYEWIPELEETPDKEGTTERIFEKTRTSNTEGALKKEENPSQEETPKKDQKRILPRKAKSYAHDAVLRGRVSKTYRVDEACYKPRSRGLHNRRNDCYRNSVLQCLLHTPEVADYLVRMTHVRQCHSGVDDCIVCALGGLAFEFLGLDNGATPSGVRLLALAEFTRVLETNIPENHEMYEDVITHVQSDAYHFLLMLQHFIKEADASAPAAGEDDSGANFSDLIDMQQYTAWTCVDCGHVSEQRHVRAPGVISLELFRREPKERYPLTDLLREHYNGQRMELRCEEKACADAKRVAKERPRTVKIVVAPEVLIVVLTRAIWTATGSETKLRDSVTYDEFLDLGPFTLSGRTLIYRLRAVTAHQGPTMKGGHYVAAVRDPLDNGFRVISDLKVEKPTGFGIMQQPDFADRASDPYVLVYSKV